MIDLLKTLGMSCPIIQAPMAGVATAKMAAAVSNAGGLGSLGLATVDAVGARTQIQAVRALTDGAFNVNFFYHAAPIRDGIKERAWLDHLAPTFEKFDAKPPATLTEIYRTFDADNSRFEMLLDECPPVVSFHFGIPTPDKIAALKNKGITTFSTAINLTDALAAQAAGIDAIVAQGWEAGGHRGILIPASPDSRLSTFALTQVLVANLTIPVIAAGGIMDGSGIRAALNMGATAAQMGTAFIDTEHSLADAPYRAALTSDAGHNTVITPILSGRPARCVANSFTAWEATTDHNDLPAYPITYDATKALIAAAKSAGDTTFAAQWAGQGAPLSRAMNTADLMDTLKSELKASK
jgi:nitronate monooxygenase